MPKIFRLVTPVNIYVSPKCESSALERIREASVARPLKHKNRQIFYKNAKLQISSEFYNGNTLTYKAHLQNASLWLYPYFIFTELKLSMYQSNEELSFFRTLLMKIWIKIA